MPGGRPPDYRVELCEIAHKMAQGGATDLEIAAALDIAGGTLYRWRNEHPEFREALKLGKEAADDRVEATLYHRSIGYSFEAVKIMQHLGQVIVEPYIEHVPPDIGAIRLWLTNRRGDRWRDKQSLEHSGPNGGPVEVFTEIVQRVVDPKGTIGDGGAG